MICTGSWSASVAEAHRCPLPLPAYSLRRYQRRFGCSRSFAGQTFPSICLVLPTRKPSWAIQLHCWIVLPAVRTIYELCLQRKHGDGRCHRDTGHARGGNDAVLSTSNISAMAFGDAERPAAMPRVAMTQWMPAATCRCLWRCVGDGGSCQGRRRFSFTGAGFPLTVTGLR